MRTYKIFCNIVRHGTLDESGKPLIVDGSSRNGLVVIQCGILNTEVGSTKGENGAPTSRSVIRKDALINFGGRIGSAKSNGTTLRKKNRRNKVVVLVLPILLTTASSFFYQGMGFCYFLP
jgi:hypothetical protein